MKKLLYLMVLLLLGGGIISFPACSSDDSESEESVDDTDNSGEGDDDDSGDGEGTIKGHEYVDLGLSVKWATCNVGADSPEECGNYYAWGETETKDSYTTSNSVLNGAWNTDICGDAEYDVARAKWGGSWRLPMKTEIQELIDGCTWTFTTMNDVKGYKVKGTNSNSIFLPAAGYYYSSSQYAGSKGYYWSSTPATSYNVYYLDFSSDSKKMSGADMRSMGMSVRPVSE